MKQISQNYNKEKGVVAIIMVSLVLAVLMLIGLGLSSLVVNQFEGARYSTFSAEAFFAADAGSEVCLYQIRKEAGVGCDGGGTTSKFLDNFAKYEVDFSVSGSEATIESLGSYREDIGSVAARKIRLTWQQ